MNALTVLLVILGVAVLGTIAYIGYRLEKKRREEMRALAGRLGWRFDPRRDRTHDDEYAHFEIFRRGHSRAAFNTLTGTLKISEQACPAKMGEFVYKITTHTGKSSSTRTYRFSYLIVHLPFREVPDLLIRREGIFDKIAGTFGFDDIDFESADFSRRFFVKSPDKRFAYDVVHPRMMQFLLATEPPAVDIEYGRCCLSDGRHRWKPQDYEMQLDWIVKFFGHWPDHVTADLKTR